MKDNEKEKIRARVWYANNKLRKILYQRYNDVRKEARKKRIDCTIKPEHMQVPTLCPIMGIPIDTPYIDRLNKSEGYTPENTIVVCSFIYKLRQHLEDKEISTALKTTIHNLSLIP